MKKLMPFLIILLGSVIAAAVDASLGIKIEPFYARVTHVIILLIFGGAIMEAVRYAMRK